MAVIDRRPFPAPATRPLHSLTVGELGAVVDGDRAKDGIKGGPEFPLEPVEGLYHIRRLVRFDFDDDLVPREALREDEEAGADFLLGLGRCPSPNARTPPGVPTSFGRSSMLRPGQGRAARRTLL